MRDQIARAGFARPTIWCRLVSTKGFGRPRAFRVEKAGSASIISRFAAVRVTRMRADSLRCTHALIGAFKSHARATELRRSRPRSARFVPFLHEKRAAARSFPC